MTQASFRRTFLTILCVVCIPVTFFLARLLSQQKVTVSDTGTAETNVSAGAFAVSVEHPEADAGTIRIPVPKDVTQEDVVLENRYLDRALYLTITTTHRGFYMDHAVTCDAEKTEGITCFLHENDTIGLLVRLTSLYEPDFRMESDAVILGLAKPYETAEHVIVLDPLYGGTGGDVSLSLAGQLRETLLSSPLSCRVFLTRTGARTASDEEVLSLIEESHASRYISLDMPGGEAALSASLSLYDGFFIRGYGNAPFASDVMRALSAVESLRADGIFTVQDNERLSAVRIPAVSVHIEGVRSPYGEDERVVSELASALGTAIRLGCANTD